MFTYLNKTLRYMKIMNTGLIFRTFEIVFINKTMLKTDERISVAELVRSEYHEIVSIIIIDHHSFVIVFVSCLGSIKKLLKREIDEK